MTFKLKGLGWNKVGSCLPFDMESLLWKEKRGCPLSELVAFVPSWMKRAWVHSSLPLCTDQVPIALPGVVCWVLRKPFKVVREGCRGWGMKFPWLCAFVLKGSWESFKPPRVGSQGSWTPWMCLHPPPLSFVSSEWDWYCPSGSLDQWRNIIRENTVKVMTR